MTDFRNADDSDGSNGNGDLTGLLSAVPATYKVRGRLDDAGGTGVLGYATAGSGAGTGVFGQVDSDAEGAAGVRGVASDDALGTAADGVYGRTDATGEAGTGITDPPELATGVTGEAVNSSGVNTYGVYGSNSAATDGTAGVAGFTFADDGQVYGVRGRTNSKADGAAGVWGKANDTTGTTYGVMGTTDSGDGYGVYTPDDAKIAGDVETTSGHALTVGGTPTLRLDPPGTDGSGTTAGGNVVAGHEGNATTGGTVGGTVGGGGAQAAANEVTDNYGTVGGGLANRAGDAQSGATNAVAATVAGGKNNVASDDGTTVGGGRHNEARAEFATIAGGGPGDTSNPDGTKNVVYSPYSTIGGGGNNVIGSLNTDQGRKSTIAGGFDNEITFNGTLATIGGGENNSINALGATICGGRENSADGTDSTIAGGFDNSITSFAVATIAGGVKNECTAGYSFAAGRKAKAKNAGAFVWGDGSSNVVETGTEDEVVFQAGGGMRVYTDSDTSTNTGAELPANSGSWSSLSTKTAKADVTPVDPAAVLDRVESLSVSTWRYEGEDDGIRHMGPMAEGFHEAFGLGRDPERISTVDADGVALAAIQGLTDRLDRENRDLRARLTETDDRIAELEAALDDKDERIDGQQEQIADLRSENRTLREANEALRDRIAEIEARLGIEDTASTPADDR